MALYKMSFGDDDGIICLGVSVLAWFSNSEFFSFKILKVMS